MLKPLISIIVCTYNRQEVLSGCMAALANQTLKKSLFEVIIINNNSTDSTQSVAEEFAGKYENFYVLTETKQGLSHARNRGWQEARGEYVAYIDDDARAYSDWAEQMYLFTRRRPEIDVFGGPYDAFGLVEIPEWFPMEVGTFSLGSEERPLKIGQEWINGSNMVFRKTLLHDLGGFDPRLGMSGDKISYGEETKLLIEIANKNIVVYYVPTMKIQHLVAQYKMNLKWLLLCNYASGRISGKTFGRKPLLTHLRNLSWAFKKTIKSMLFNDKTMPFKKRIYYSLNNLFYSLGGFVEYFDEH